MALTGAEKFAQEQVDRGVIFLDERFPGWFNRINLETLDVSCHWGCVLGQLVGSFGKATHMLGSNNGVPLGFDGSAFLNSEELTEAWRRTILRLRAERAMCTTHEPV
jgi:hypothetical protein